MSNKPWFVGLTVGLGLAVVGCAFMSESNDSAAPGSGDPSSYYQPGTPTPTATTPAATSSPTSYYVPGGDAGTETAVATNPFVLTSFDPLSTFAADVDTASYDVFRRDLQRGVLPAPDGVRLEEYVNYFRYAYPVPAADSGEAFSVSVGAAANPFGRDTTLLRVGIQGKDAPPQATERANLVFLVDVSGSMAEANKLPLAQEVLRQALDLLAPADTVSIVTYASGTAVALGPTPLSERVAIEQAIGGLTASGSTAGAAGLGLAYQQAEAAFVASGINHVILCTDGDFNVGPSSTSELVALIRSQQQTGINLTVLGFGSGNLNDSMMSALSHTGNGIYSVITDLDQATRYVSERLLATIHLIAKDVKIQVEFNSAEVYAYRLLGYETRALSDAQFLDDSADAGEVGARHRVTALFELVRTGQAIPRADGAPPPQGGAVYAGPVDVSPTELVRVKLRYRDPWATADAPLYELSRGLEMAQSSGEMDPDFAWAASMAAFAEILKASPYALPESLPALSAVVSAPVYATDPDRAEFVSLLAAARGLLGG
jgi:Ca-activated chloride channel family protein